MSIQDQFDDSEYFLPDYGRRNGTITYPNGDIYTGELRKIKEEDDDEDYPDGYGIMRYANGDVHHLYGYLDLEHLQYYQLLHHLLENGTSIYSNGNLCDGAISTARGIMLYANGDVYNGEWYNDLKHGPGVMNYANGDVYAGQWENDLKHRKGNMFYANGDKYNGQWLNDLINGTGTMTYANEDVYVGQWLNGFKNGTGTMTYANGDVYEGEWVNDSPIDFVQDTTDPIKLQSFKHIPKDVQIFNPILGYEENLHEFLNERDNFIFIVGEHYYALSKETIKMQMNNPENIVYECVETDPLPYEFILYSSSGRPKINEDKYNKKVKYLRLNSLALPGDFILLKTMKHIYSDEYERIFNLVKTEKILKSVISQNVIQTLDFVSASHCQSGSGGFVYDVNTKFIRAYSKRNRKRILSITKKKKGYMSKSKSSKLRSNIFFPHESNSKSSKSK
jgi:hypothetical protein